MKLADSADEEIEEARAAPTHPEETLGMTVRDVTSEVAERLDLEIDKGVIVVDVEAGGLAEQHRVVPGDVILEVNRQPIKTVAEFRKAVDDAKPGDWIMLLLNRGKQRLIVHIKKP